MSIANLCFVPCVVLLSAISIIVLLCFLKFKSLRKYRRRRNWFVYAFIALTIYTLAYQIYDQSLGFSIIRYSLESEPFFANQASPLEFTVESLGRRETSFNLIITVTNASLSADNPGIIHLNRTAIKIPLNFQNAHEMVTITVHFQMDDNVAGCAFNTAVEPIKSRPTVTGSIEGAISVWNDKTGKYTLHGIYGPSV
jgi:hypothetical protein